MNTNALIRNARWHIGLSKTGYIEEGGRCLVMRTQLGQRSVVIVLLNSSGKHTHFADAIRIKEWIEPPTSAYRRNPYRQSPALPSAAAVDHRNP